jgi:O-antigen/teichoic acid export membrane protein
MTEQPYGAGPQRIAVPPGASILSTTRWLPWLRDGSLAVTDQALISSSNFILNVLLARWLTPTEYGIYALAFSGYLLLLSFFQALVLEPMCVLGASEFRDDFNVYIAAILRLQACFSAPLIILLGAGAWISHILMPDSSLAGTLVGLAVGCPLLLSFWVMRTATYVTLKPGRAARIAFLYALIVTIAIGLWRSAGPVTAGGAFLIMGIAAGAVSILLVRQLRPDWRGKTVTVRQVAREHWNFGRWELSKVGVDWTCENISYAVAGSLLGIAETGKLKALTTLFLPLNQTLTALRRIFLPYLSRISKHSGHSATGDRVKVLAILYAAGAAVYGVTLTILSKPIVGALYGEQFRSITDLIPYFAFTLVFAVPVNALDMGLRAARSPKSVFLAASVSTLSPLLVTWPMTWMFGMRGLIMTSLVTSAIFLTTMTWSLRRRIRLDSGAVLSSAHHP